MRKGLGTQASSKRPAVAFSRWDAVEVLALCVVLSLLVWGVYTVRDPATFPVRKVVVSNPLVHVDPRGLQHAVVEHLRGGLIGVDLARVGHALENLPWVQNVAVRRQWPDALVIELSEHRPVARWGTGALLSDRAEVFAPRDVREYETLPVLHGPTGRELEVLTRYLVVAGLLEPNALSVRALVLDTRRAWRMLLGNGVPVELGRGPIEDRVRRLSWIYSRALAGRSDGIEKIDLRYTHGLAVAWKVVGERARGKDAAS